MDGKIFISHSSKDKEYGEVLVKLLLGIGIKGSQILFTSNPDYGIPTGENIFEYLKNQIHNDAHMLYLLSDHYYDNVVCMNEMGAAWVMQHISYAHAPRVSCQCRKISKWSGGSKSRCSGCR